MSGCPSDNYCLVGIPATGGACRYSRLEIEIMQIRAMYIRTTQRDRYDGRAQFEIIPQGDCNLHTPGRHNALECVGNIQPYLPGMPVLLEGDFDGCKLHVRNDWFDVRTRSGIDTMLSWMSSQHLNGRLTVSQIDKIINACNGDLFAFFEDDDCRPVLLEICKKSKHHEETVNTLVKDIRYLIHQQDFVTTLRRYNVPFDRIDKMLRKGITMAELHKNPYIVFSRFDVPLAIADTFARQECSTEPYARIRCEGYVVAALRYLASCGHTCCTMEQLVGTVNGR